jgi:hypothetical protein
LSTADIAARLERIEASVVTLVRLYAPTASMAEVMGMLGLKSRTAARAWLKARGIAPAGRKYDRATILLALQQ